MGEPPTIVLGGDPASIRAVADWYRSHLAPLAEEAESAVRQVLRDHIESWRDPASERFAMNLREGLPTILRFVDALHKRARLLDHMADVLEAAQIASHGWSAAPERRSSRSRMAVYGHPSSS